ncbi:MAG: type II toxin-antitoxin system VapC family toxin [Pseudomonadota bacterium]|nr:type II toxin-antitoxin system VapC family toxin [Pseudomonadota bacterium]
MIALDTNVLVRALTRDDPAQTPAAQHLLGHAGGVFISKTVLLELEWVLRAAYRQPPAAIHQALLRLLSLPHVAAEQPEHLAQALNDFAAGMDFADALHLAAAQAAGLPFHTFDTACAKAARRLGRQAVPVKPKKH